MKDTKKKKIAGMKKISLENVEYMKNAKRAQKIQVFK